LAVSAVASAEVAAAGVALILAWLFLVKLLLQKLLLLLRQEKTRRKLLSQNLLGIERAI
jgi:hypothetical protein